MDKEILTSIISNNIAHFRKLSGMTQAELAERLNYSDKSVSKWERGDGIPDVIVLSEMAEIFGVSVNSFLDENSLQKKKIKPPLSFAKKLIIAFLCSVLVWFVITTIFVFISLLLSFADADFSSQWVVFVYAVPVMAIVDLVLCEIWKWKVASFFMVSLLIWGLTASVHASMAVFLMPLNSLPLVYLIPAVLQILAALWYGLRFMKQRKQ